MAVGTDLRLIAFRFPSARTDHLRNNPRTDLYVPEDEAELDAQLASLNLDPECSQEGRGFPHLPFWRMGGFP